MGRKNSFDFMDDYKEPYNKVLKYIKEHIDNEDLKEIFGDDYDKLKLEYSDDNTLAEVLADTITDSELSELDYYDNDDFDEDDFDDVEYYDDVYDNIDENQLMSVINFLKDLDEDILYDLFNGYDCYNLTDLATTIPNYILYGLGYEDSSVEESVSNISNLCENLTKYNYLKEYNENLDFLEDLPKDINIYVIDDIDNILATDSEADFYDILSYIDRSLIDDIYIMDDVVDGELFIFKIKQHDFREEENLDYTNNDYSIDEDVVINDTLNPEIFDLDTNKVKDEVRTSLINYVDDFISDLKSKDQAIDISYTDIVLIGSNAGYLYKPDSDIDVHVILSEQIMDENFAETLFNLADLYEDAAPYFIGDSKVELGFEDNYEYTTMTNKDGGRRYSLINDEWVNNSDKLEQYKQGDESLVDGYEDIVKDLTEKIDNIIANDDLNAALLLKQEIRQNRSDDLANIGSISMGNVVFKELRDNGSYGKLKDYIYNAEVEAGGFIE